MKKSLLCLVLISQLVLASSLHAGGEELSAPSSKSAYLWTGLVAFFGSLVAVSDAKAVRIVSEVPPSTAVQAKAPSDSAANSTANRAANSTAAFMAKKGLRGSPCDGCFCDPCPPLPTDCCPDYDACASDIAQCDSQLSGCAAQLGSCGPDLSACQFDRNFCQSSLSNCNSYLANCHTSLTVSQQATATCGTQLTSTQTALAQSQNTLFAVGQVCTEVNGCYQDLTNLTSIREVLMEKLPDLNITDAVVDGVREAMVAIINKGHCVQATTACNGVQYPAAPSCPAAASSGSSLANPQYGMMAGLVGGAILLNHHDLFLDGAESLFQTIQCSVKKLSGFISAPNTEVSQ